MRHLFVLPLITAFLLAGCTSEENAVRSAVQEVYAAAQRGDIAFAIDLMDSANPVSAILQHIRAEQGEEAYDEALAELGARSRETLAERTLRIESVDIDGDRAVVRCVLVGDGRDIQSEAIVNRIGGAWRPYTLPGLPRSAGSE